MPTEYEGRGNDYMKAPVEERFEIKNGKAQWKNRTEQGEQSVTGEAFYFPSNPPPEFIGVLARALLKAPGHRLPLLPAGEARSKSQANSRSGKIELIQYRIIGLGFYPADDLARSQRKHGGKCVELVLSLPSSISKMRYRSCRKPNKLQTTFGRGVSRMQIAHVPKGDLLIRNARLFDPRDLSVTPGMSVLVRGDRIVRVAPDADIKPSAGR